MDEVDDELMGILFCLVIKIVCFWDLFFLVNVMFIFLDFRNGVMCCSFFERVLGDLGNELKSNLFVILLLFNFLRSLVVVFFYLFLYCIK